MLSRNCHAVTSCLPSGDGLLVQNAGFLAEGWTWINICAENNSLCGEQEIHGIKTVSNYPSIIDVNSVLNKPRLLNCTMNQRSNVQSENVTLAYE